MFVVGLLVFLASLALPVAISEYEAHLRQYQTARVAMSPEFRQFLTVVMPLCVIGAILGTVGGTVVMYGSLMMKRLQSYGFAVIAALLVMLTFYLAPLGIWALWRLTRPEMRAAFGARAMGKGFVELEVSTSAVPVPFSAWDWSSSAHIGGALVLDSAALGIEYRGIGTLGNSPLKTARVPLGDIGQLYLKDGWRSSTLCLVSARLGTLVDVPGYREGEAQFRIESRYLPAARRLVATVRQQLALSQSHREPPAPAALQSAAAPPQPTGPVVGWMRARWQSMLSLMIASRPAADRGGPAKQA
jgi:hypothetical protein